jgi:ABC-type Fe3+-hydroxamate transport system substrate-binding protein
MKKHVAAALLLFTALSGCGAAAESASTAATTSTASAPAPTVTTTVAVTPTPTPALIKTSGSYKADLAALGIKPDNVQNFADFMKKEICDETGTNLGVNVRSIGGNSTGGGPDGVRLTVAYFCPTKSQEVESYLDYFDQ